MSPSPTMLLPAFSPIEIDIPDLVRFQKFEEEFRIHKQIDAAWKARVESTLKEYGIDLTRPPSPESESMSVSISTQTTEVTQSSVFPTSVPLIISCRSLPPEQWKSRPESKKQHQNLGNVGSASGSTSESRTQLSGPGEDNFGELDHQDNNLDQNLSQSQSQNQNQLTEESCASAEYESGSRTPLVIIDSNKNLSDSGLRSSVDQGSCSYADIDISEVFQYPPPSQDSENESDNGNEDAFCNVDEEVVEHILPDTPQKGINICKENYPELSITESLPIEEIQTVERNRMNMNVDPIVILPTETLSVTSAPNLIQQIQMTDNSSGENSSSNLNVDVNSGSSVSTSSGVNVSVNVIQSALSPSRENTNTIWNDMLDKGLFRPLSSNGNGNCPVFFPVSKVSPNSVPTTPNSSQYSNSGSRSHSRSGSMTPLDIPQGSEATTPPSLAVHTSTNRRRLNFRPSHSHQHQHQHHHTPRNLSVLKSFQHRLRHSNGKKGFDYVNNITADAVARSRRMDRDVEDSIPGYQKDQMEAMNHIETLTQTCRNGQERKIYRCALCGYNGPRDTTVLMHIRMVHIGADRRFPCPHCQFRFKNSGHLRKHIQRKHSDTSGSGFGVGRRGRGGNEVEFDQSEFDELERDGNASEDPEGEGEGNGERNANDPLQDDGMDYEDSDSHPPGTSANSLDDSQLREAYELFQDDEMNSRFLCLFCDTVYIDESAVIDHILSSHKCSSCNETFQVKERLEEHKKYCYSSTSANTNDNGNTNSTLTSPTASGSSFPNGSGNGNGYGSGYSNSGNSRNDHYLNSSVASGGGSGQNSKSSLSLNKSRKRANQSQSQGNPLKKNKNYSTNAYTFTEAMKQFLDPKIINVKSSKPPYTCSICKVVINSTRQSARLHVRNVHFKKCAL